MNFLSKKSVFFAVMSIVFMAVLLIIFREFAFDSSKLMLNSDQLNSIGSRILRAPAASVAFRLSTPCSAMPTTRWSPSNS